MVELKGTIDSGPLSVVGVNEYRIGPLSGGVRGSLGFPYEISYNASMKAELPALNIGVATLRGSVEYRPTGFDGGAVRVTGSGRIGKVEITTRTTVDLESDNVTGDFGFSFSHISQVRR